MIILYRKMVRPSINVPFFNQMITDPAPWDVYPIHYTLKSNIAVYEMRYSRDLLERHSLWSFDSQMIYDTWHNDPEMQIRYNALLAYGAEKNIILTETVTDMTETEFDQFKTETSAVTWPSEFFNLSVIPGVGQDEFLGDDSTQKPEGDNWQLHPWFINL
jgi:hypothetical protein